MECLKNDMMRGGIKRRTIIPMDRNKIAGSSYEMVFFPGESFAATNVAIIANIKVSKTNKNLLNIGSTPYRFFIEKLSIL